MTAALPDRPVLDVSSLLSGLRRQSEQHTAERLTTALRPHWNDPTRLPNIR